MSAKKLNKKVRVLIILIPIIILSYLIYQNFLVDQEFHYFYDIGTENENYISPDYRISEQMQEEINYREAIGHILYFYVPVTQGSTTIKVQAKIKDNLPEDQIAILGAQNDIENWSYVKHEVLTSTNSNEWILIETEFNIEEEQLTPNNNKLSLVLWFEHLNSEQYQDYTIPIDYINITVYKPSILK